MHKIKYILCLAVVSHIIISAICAYALEIEDNLSSGYKAYKNGNFETAIAHLESAKGDDSILSDFALYYLGEAHLSISNLDEALNSFLNFVDYHTKSPLTPYAMEKVGDVYLAKGQTVSSINAYKKFLEKYPNSTQTQNVIYKLISILFSNDKYEEAIPFIKRLIIEFPQTEFIRQCNVYCQHMRKITLPKILAALENEEPEVFVDEDIRKKALIPIQRMLKVR